MADTFDITVQQNATFDMTLELTDPSGSYINLTSWVISGSIKSSFKDVVPVTSFNVNILSAISGAVELTLTSTQTALLTKPQYYYDVVAKDSTTVPPSVYRLVQGQVKNDLGVTTV